MPLHPVVVHFPIALSVLLPLVSAVVLAGWWAGWWPRRTWGLAALLAALLAASSFVAVRTGETDEERVEQTVSEALVETHEHRAEVFAWFTLLPLAFAAAAALVRDERIARGLAVASVGAALAAGGLAYGVGHAGGAIVYGSPASAGPVSSLDGAEDDD